MLIRLLKKFAAHLVTTFVRSGWPRLGMMLLAMEQGLSLKHRRQQRLFRLMSVAEGASLLSVQNESLLPNCSVTLEPIRRLGAHASQADLDQRERTVDIPELNFYVFRDVKIIGGTEMLCPEGEVLLYDELALGNPDHYGCKAFGIIPAQAFGLHLPACKNGRVLISHASPERATIPRGIHLCKDHSGNYFHWLFECLPRAIVAMGREESAGFPLLIDAQLPKQNLQALEQIAGDREIIRIKHRDMHLVGELAFPGSFSFMHDNYGNKVAAEDLLVSPEAVRLLRETYVRASCSPGCRMLYVARDQAKYRRLCNENQIQQIVTEFGFEIVRPENLSFSEQIAMFSNASVIVGPTGAGLSNMVFAPEGCKVIVLAGATEGANYFIFGQLAQWLKHELVYATGLAKHPGKLHSDYNIDPVVLHNALAELRITLHSDG